MSKYFILDSRSIIGNEALWWRPDSQGYTTNLNEAGVYDESWVKKGLRSTDIPVPVEVARKLAHSSVNADKLAQAGVTGSPKKNVRPSVSTAQNAHASFAPRIPTRFVRVARLRRNAVS